MNFRFSMFPALLLAALLLGVSPGAQAQTNANGTGQQIMFTSPEGQVSTNLPLPVAEAPRPEVPSDYSSDSAAISVVDQSYPAAVFPRPAPAFIPRDNSEDPMDPMGEKKRMHIETSAEIMHVPTMEQIFGISQPNSVSGQTNGTAWGSQNTNILYSDSSSSDEQAAEDSRWQNILSGKTGPNNAADTSLFGSDKTKKSGDQNQNQSLWSSIFNGPPDDNSLSGNQDKNSPDSQFDQSSSQPTLAQIESDSSLTRPLIAPPPQTPPAPAQDAAMDSHFTLPQNPTFDALPVPPMVPAVSGQNFTPSSTPVPSWEPKSAPWLSPVPPLGTMAQRKFN